MFVKSMRKFFHNNQFDINAVKFAKFAYFCYFLILNHMLHAESLTILRMFDG